MLVDIIDVITLSYYLGKTKKEHLNFFSSFAVCLKNIVQFLLVLPFKSTNNQSNPYKPICLRAKRGSIHAVDQCQCKSIVQTFQVNLSNWL